MYTIEIRKERMTHVLLQLKLLVPEARMILEWSNAWELVVAVVLSAQCTDVQVNKVTRELFKKYPTLEDYLHVDQREFEQDIYSTGFYKSKATHILAGARMVYDRFGGQIPRTIAELVQIPGVGRKTANVVLGNAYGIVEGIAVDTHVKRFARNFGFTTSTDPEQIERDLMALLPHNEWFPFTYYVIEYGRQYCTARCRHTACPLRSFLVHK